MSNEDPCLHFEAKLVPDLRTKIKKRLIAAIYDLKQPCIPLAARALPTILSGRTTGLPSGGINKAIRDGGAVGDELYLHKHG